METLWSELTLFMFMGTTSFEYTGTDVNTRHGRCMNSRPVLGSLQSPASVLALTSRP